MLRLSMAQLLARDATEQSLACISLVFYTCDGLSYILKSLISDFLLCDVNVQEEIKVM
jgi:hypothetical protein